VCILDDFISELHLKYVFSENTVRTIRSIQKTHDREHVNAAYREATNQQAQQAGALASTVAKKLQSDFPELKIISKGVEGEPGEALVREAEKIDADIIVVGNKRVQGPARILGSIARTVASEANYDLHVVQTH